MNDETAGAAGTSPEVPSVQERLAWTLGGVAILLAGVGMLYVITNGVLAP